MWILIQTTLINITAIYQWILFFQFKRLNWFTWFKKSVSKFILGTEVKGTYINMTKQDLNDHTESDINGRGLHPIFVIIL